MFHPIFIKIYCYCFILERRDSEGAWVLVLRLWEPGPEKTHSQDWFHVVAQTFKNCNKHKSWAAKQPSSHPDPAYHLCMWQSWSASWEQNNALGRCFGHTRKTETFITLCRCRKNKSAAKIWMSGWSFQFQMGWFHPENGWPEHCIALWGRKDLYPQVLLVVSMRSILFSFEAIHMWAVSETSFGSIIFHWLAGIPNIIINSPSWITPWNHGMPRLLQCGWKPSKQDWGLHRISYCQRSLITMGYSTLV